MSLKDPKQIILEKMLSDLEIPDSAYEKAIVRYEDLGAWFSREESSLQELDPHVFPQGSFRMGTANRPITGDEAYDLDLSCKLRIGVSKTTHTQEQLKSMIGKELEEYRMARGIKAALIPKHRCWRLEYQDELSFHIDIIPCIPEDETTRSNIKQILEKSWMNNVLANSASETTVVITDDRHPRFKSIASDWKISNPEGYAEWFEDRMRLPQLFNELKKAQLDQVPVYQRKTPLQRVVQILKRHRDIMFKDDPESKPISIIITTLAARAYSGEQDLATALTEVLARMEGHVNNTAPRIPNPVDPNEDFADRWAMAACRHLNLEKNFRLWLTQAKSDFAHVTKIDDIKLIVGQAERKFGVHLNESDLAKSLGVVIASHVRAPSVQIIRESEAPRPWRVNS